LKWPGGKRRLLAEIKKRLPDSFNTYFEPFLGGGAVLFYLRPESAVISDANAELIGVYESVRDNLKGLLIDLQKHENTPDYYYEMRSWDRHHLFNKLDKLFRASRFFYLSKTCYNGICRVNRKGQINIAYGKYKNINIDTDALKSASEFLQNPRIKILHTDFAEAVSGAQAGDFVYFDPPYDGTFTQYTASCFSDGDQIRLKELCESLDKKGVKFLLSNSDTEFINDLYKDFIVETIHTSRNISNDSTKRGAVSEVLVRNYK
jgi:DNA adenine methylase